MMLVIITKIFSSVYHRSIKFIIFCFNNFINIGLEVNMFKNITLLVIIFGLYFETRLV